MITRFVTGVKYQDASASTRFAIYFCFTDDHRIPERGQKTKARIQTILTNVFKLDEFKTYNSEAKSLLLGSGAKHAMMLAALIPTPRSLHDVWQQLQDGVGMAFLPP